MYLCIYVCINCTYVRTYIYTYICTYMCICSYPLSSPISTNRAQASLTLAHSLYHTHALFLPFPFPFHLPSTLFRTQVGFYALYWASRGLAMHNGLCGTRFKHVWNSICRSQVRSAEICFVVTKRLKAAAAQLLCGVFFVDQKRPCTHTHTLKKCVMHA